MNYGYAKGCLGWKPGKKAELAKRLTAMLQEQDWGDPTLTEQYLPYLEVDGLYPGVRIRHITHLTPRQQRDLVAKSDAIYDEVMGNKQKQQVS